MPGPTKTRTMARVAAAALAALVLAVPAAASAQDNPPIITSAAMTPATLPPEGGEVTVTADILDDFGIYQVYGDLTGPDASVLSVQMLPSSLTTWTGTAMLPPNPTYEPIIWGANVTATDIAGQFDTKPTGLVTIAGRPKVVVPGHLSSSPASKNFGTVPVGGSARVTLTIRRTGQRTTTPIEAEIVPPPAPFAVMAATGPFAFSLLPGETKTVVMEFQPTSAGTFSDTLSVVRPDGGQPGLAIKLSGRAR